MKFFYLKKRAEKAEIFTWPVRYSIETGLFEYWIFILAPFGWIYYFGRECLYSLIHDILALIEALQLNRQKGKCPYCPNNQVHFLSRADDFVYYSKFCPECGRKLGDKGNNVRP